MRHGCRYCLRDLPISPLFLMLKKASADFSTEIAAKARSVPGDAPACNAPDWAGRPAKRRSGSPTGRPPCYADRKSHPFPALAAQGVQRRAGHSSAEQIDGQSDRRSREHAGRDRAYDVWCRLDGPSRTWVPHGGGMNRRIDRWRSTGGRPGSKRQFRLPAGKEKS